MKNKNYKHIALGIAIVIAVFALGLLAGYGLGYKTFSKSLPSMRTLLILSAQGQIAGLQYLNADYKEAREALMNYINLLDDLKANGEIADKYLNLRSYYVDRGLSYARLSLLEEKAGNKLDMQKNMQEASKMFRMAGWKDYSEARIRLVLERIDKKFQSEERK
jgi:hypothetical protein